MPILNDEIKSYSLIYKNDREKAVKELEDNNITNYIVLNKLLIIVYVDSNFNEQILNSMDEIVWWEKSYPMSSLIEITNNLDSGEDINDIIGVSSTSGNIYENITGKGVVVAIIDSGIDYLNESFINSDRTSKILYIWDQESNLKEPPVGLNFGSEFTRDDINEAIRQNDSTLTTDEIGTGTLASGIIVSSKNGDYEGIAPDSNLIVVKLRSYKSLYKEGRINYKNTDFLVAIYYLIEKFKELDTPLIINLTLGVISGQRSTYTLLNTFENIYRSGIIIISGAGNEGNTDIHFSDKIEDGESRDFTFQVEDDLNLDILLDAKSPDKLGIAIISPLGEISETVLYSPEYKSFTGKFNLEDVEYTIFYGYPWLSMGGLNISISLKNVSSGVWTLRVIGDEIINGNYDAYLPNKNLISEETRFIDSDSSGTITRYALMNEIITIGTYNNKTSSIWIGSSKGSEETKFSEPDIVAPGVDIISTDINNTFNTITGTGVSSSVVCGVVALMIEFIIGQTEFYKLSIFSEPLKTYLMLGATQKLIYNYPNIAYGYGVLDYKNTLTVISQTL